MLCLASVAGRALAQDRAVTTAKSEEDRIVPVDPATVEDAEASGPIQFVPLAPGTVFEPYTVFADDADVAAGVSEQLVYSNTLGTFVAALGGGNLVADDLTITVTVPGGCKLTRYEFPVVGKFDPAGIGGPYTVDFALYRSCPGSVSVASRPSLIIPGTQGQSRFLDDAPRLISFVPGPNVSLQTNMWLGVKFSRSNAGVIVGTPPLQGFSCDQFDFPGFPCSNDLGGFPDQPQASFNLQIYADSACSASFTGYKDDRPSGSTYNPGQNVVFADDIQLVNGSCDLIAYEIAVKGVGYYTFDMRLNCEGPAIPDTEQSFPVGSGTEVKILRFIVNPPVPVPQNLWFSAKISNATGQVVIAGQQACIGSTEDLIESVGPEGCAIVPPDVLGTGVHGAFSLTITCAGPAPVGACCDTYMTDPDGAAVCRQVPETNCPFPPRFSSLQPAWVDGEACEPDPFGNHTCGQAACCYADEQGDQCTNLTQAACDEAGDPTRPRQWQIGRYCSQEGQRCPRIACLGRTGECTLPRCQSQGGVCDTTRDCVGGLNAGNVCTANANCRVCSNKTCTGNRVCSNKKCSGYPINTVCTGTDQGTCPAGQTCNFINCTNNTPCTPVGGGTCPAAVSVCTGTDQGTCPPNQTCSFITCTSDSVCTPVGNGTCPAGGVCGTPPNICSAGLIGRECSWNSQCDCSGNVGRCQVNSTCCDKCPPVGCENADCCEAVCNHWDGYYCCAVEWDADCASLAADPQLNLCSIAPANDVCVPDPIRRIEGARLLVIPPSGVVTAETDSGRATQSADDPGFGCYIPLPPPAPPGGPGSQGLQTVWYKFYATQTSALFQTCNSNAPADDSLLEVFAVGDPSDPLTQCRSLIPIGCSDDFPGCSDSGTNSKICVRGLIPGNLYYVLVASKLEVEDGIKYRLDIISPSPCPGDSADPVINNDCPRATTITDGTTHFGPDDLPKATLTAPVPFCIPNATADVWYRYMATCTGTLTVETCGTSAETSPDTNLAIYDQGLCPYNPFSGAPLVCSTNAGGDCGQGSKVEIDVVEGSFYTIRLADEAQNGPEGDLKVACIQADCPAGVMMITSPPDGVVDAGRPSAPNNAALKQGIKTITAIAPHAALASCFTLCDTAFPVPVPANSVASIVEVGDPPGPYTYTITLARPITAGALTTLTYTDVHGLKSTGRFTSHPSNVDADPIASAADEQRLVDILNGTGTPLWGLYSDDIDRSASVTPADILEEIDLLNGAGAYDPWDGTPNQSSSPFCPPP